MPLVAPSVLAADFANLQRDVEMINSSSADYFHIDIMDGVFVPNISFGFPVTESIYRHAKKPLDFHLMLQDPTPYLESCKNSGAEIITVHLEACSHLHRVVQQIKALGCKAGVALNPHSPVSSLLNIVEDIDLILLMSVNPGFGGQKFIEGTIQKTAEARALIDNRKPEVLLEIDGGVNADNAKELVSSGANMLVAGSSVFRADDPAKEVDILKNIS